MEHIMQDKTDRMRYFFEDQIGSRKSPGLQYVVTGPDSEINKAGERDFTLRCVVDFQNDYFPGGKMELHKSDEASLKARAILEYLSSAA